jgi:hypothetical protein
MDKVIAAIAKRCLNISTLRTRNSDSKDFYDLHVGNIREALAEAYAAGKDAGRGEVLAKF